MLPASGAYRWVRSLSAVLIVSYSLPYASGSDTSGTLPQLQQQQQQQQQQHASPQRRPLALEGGVDASVDEAPGSITGQDVDTLQDPTAKDSEGALDDLVAELEEQLLSEELTLAVTATTLERLGEALALQGEYERSADAFSRAVTANKTLFGATSAQTVESLTGLGLALLEQGLFSPAAAALGRALPARMLEPPQREETRVAGLTRNLDGLAKALASEPVEEEQDEFKHVLAAVDHINRVAWHCFVNSWPYEGETVMLAALDLIQNKESRLEPSRPRDLVISAYLFNLGFLRLSILGQYGSAADLLQEAHGLRVALLGDVHTLTVEAVVSRGWALTLMGETQMAVEELTSAAEALLAVGGRAATAERLLRQALLGASDPLGVASYSHVCYTQHINMLRGWGRDGAKKAEKFVKAQAEITKGSNLSPKTYVVSRARKALGQALMAQVESDSEEEELLQLSKADRDQLLGEARALMK